MSHSKTPWHLKYTERHIYKVNDRYVASCYRAGDAKLIIRAVNQHEALVAENAALKQRVENLEAALKFVIDGYSLDISHEQYRASVYNAALDAMEESQP